MSRRPRLVAVIKWQSPEAERRRAARRRERAQRRKVKQERRP